MKTNHRVPCMFLSFVAFAAHAFGQTIERVSVGPDGAEANSSSSGASLSLDGRFVAFRSDASNLVPDDTNEDGDVFVRDMQTGSVERVSLGSQGQQGNRTSYDPDISSDGRYVSFTSIASNFVKGDITFTWDVFHRDRVTGVTKCVSLDVNGSIGMPGDYGYATGFSSISADGRYVAFHSDKLNLSSSPPSQYQHSHVYVRDTWLDKTQCVSVDLYGVQGEDASHEPSMSASGRYVAFHSEAALVPGWDISLSYAVYLRDLRLGKTIGVAYGIRPSISADGRFVAYNDHPWEPPYLSRVFVRDMLLGTTITVGEGNARCEFPSISPNGRYVSYESAASNILGGDPLQWTDVFCWDRLTDVTRIVSASASGGVGDGNSYGGCALSDGRVAFDSAAWDLVPGDTNGAQDVFLKSP